MVESESGSSRSSAPYSGSLLPGPQLWFSVMIIWFIWIVGSGQSERSDTDSVSLTRDPKLLLSEMILQFFRSDPDFRGSDPEPVNHRIRSSGSL